MIALDLRKLSYSQISSMLGFLSFMWGKIDFHIQGFDAWKIAELLTWTERIKSGPLHAYCLTPVNMLDKTMIFCRKTFWNSHVVPEAPTLATPRDLTKNVVWGPSQIQSLMACCASLSHISISESQFWTMCCGWVTVVLNVRFGFLSCWL